LLQKLLKNIREAEFAQEDNGPSRKKSSQMDPVNKTINEFVTYMLSKNIWVSCVKLFENFKRSVPNDPDIIQGLVEFAYCSFCYQYFEQK